jgi:hypothetical protein
MNSGLVVDKKLLLAWNPVSLGRGLISDVVPLLATAQTPVVASTYFFFPRHTSSHLDARDIRPVVLTKQDVRDTMNLPSLFAHGKNGGNLPSISAPDKVLQAILVALQPFNFKLNDMLYRHNSGTGTPGDEAFYHNLITVFFDQQLPGIANNYKGTPGGIGIAISAASLALKQDLQPFGTSAVTPF